METRYKPESLQPLNSIDESDGGDCNKPTMTMEEDATIQHQNTSHVIFTKADIKIEVRIITDDAEKELILALMELLLKLQESAEVSFLG